jgi:dTDP-4-dehydrorhamnose reductase
LKTAVIVTGASGQLGQALLEVFPEARGLTRAEWDVTFPPPTGLSAELVLHTAAWTNVDGAEDDPQSAAAVNVGGVQHAAEIGAPLVRSSTTTRTIPCRQQKRSSWPRSW